MISNNKFDDKWWKDFVESAQQTNYHAKSKVEIVTATVSFSRNVVENFRKFNRLLTVVNETQASFDISARRGTINPDNWQLIEDLRKELNIFGDETFYMALNATVGVSGHNKNFMENIVTIARNSVHLDVTEKEYVNEDTLDRLEVTAGLLETKIHKYEATFDKLRNLEVMLKHEMRILHAHEMNAAVVPSDTVFNSLTKLLEATEIKTAPKIDIETFEEYVNDFDATVAQLTEQENEINVILDSDLQFVTESFKARMAAEEATPLDEDSEEKNGN